MLNCKSNFNGGTEKCWPLFYMVWPNWIDYRCGLMQKTGNRSVWLFISLISHNFIHTFQQLTNSYQYNIRECIIN